MADSDSDDVSPHASQYQSDPWVPNVDPDASDHGDEEDAAEQYAEIYGVTATTNPPDNSDDPPGEMVTMPKLSMAYATSPDLVPSESGGGSDAMPTLPDTNAFSIDLGALRGAEQTFLDAVSNVTSAYESLRTKVQAAIDNPNLFGQEDGHYEASGAHGSLRWQDDELADSGAQFAASINPQLTKIMQDGAGGIELMGTFTALLNNAGQTYAAADAKSSMDPSAQATAQESDTGSASAV
ncbi:hypothetical protein ACWDFR_18505 [Streptomyces sp. 900105755]|uniref:Type VII secretion system-associated protein n=1 Tax=Streptomyces sp. 900105755 TaxID=3154389 RepID=A0ABV1TUX5_9ACTN